MNKTLKIDPLLVPLVLGGTKTSTFRFFDDKDLQVGDVVEFVEGGSGNFAAKVKLTNVYEKSLGDLNEDDWEGHQPIGKEDIYKRYHQYYEEEIGPETKVKIVQFKLIE